MRGTKSLLAALLLAGLVVGCQNNQKEPVRSTSSTGGTSVAPSGERADEKDMALVRFINADPNRNSVSAYMDSNVAFSDVSFKTVTPYRQVPDGRHTFHLGDQASMQAGRGVDVDVHANRREGVGADVKRDRDNRDNDNVTHESESLGGGNYYTVVLRPAAVDERDDKEGNRPRIEVIKDDFGSPKDDKAQIRVINAATYPEKLDIYMRPKNDELFSNVDATTSPSYKDVDPGNVSLEIRKDGSKQAFFTLPSTRVEAGKLYTIVLTNKGTNGRNIDAVVVEDHYLQHRDTQGGMDRDNDNDRSYDKR